LPGRVDHPMARGCHRLLREGARLVEEPEEILEELGLVATAVDEEKSHPEPPADAVQLRLLCELEGDTVSASELSERTGVDVVDISTALVELELARRVARGPGGLYRLV